MDKEEVLAKSRMENKGRDMPVIEERKPIIMTITTGITFIISTFMMVCEIFKIYP